MDGRRFAYFIRGDNGWEFIGILTGEETIEADRLYLGSVFGTKIVELD